MRQYFTSIPYIPPSEPEPLLSYLRERGVPRTFKRGEVVKSANLSGKLYLVESGICAYIQETHKQPFIPFLLLPGRTLGDISVLAGKHYNIEWRAITPAKLLKIDPMDLLDAMVEHPDWALLKVRHIIEKEESALEALAANLAQPSEVRLKILLKGLLQELGAYTPEAQWMTMPYRLNAEMFGMVVNLNRANVSRLIGQWRKEGLIERRGLTLSIHQKLFDNLYDWIENS